MNIKNMTRTALKVVIAIVTMTSAAYYTSAQEYVSTPVSISKEKVKINGKVCYSHIVLEKQTLYSIAKAYNVSMEDIYSYNPALKETGLKKNSIILIPSSEETVQVVEQTKKPKTHVRKWYEDIDVIAEKYGVTVEAIMKANNLTGKKLSNRQKLIIPDPEEIVAAETAEAETETVETADTVAVAENPETDVPEEEEEEPEWLFRPKDKVVMTLILPMHNNSGNPNRNNLDFYSGFMLAVNDICLLYTSPSPRD